MRAADISNNDCIGNTMAEICYDLSVESMIVSHGTLPDWAERPIVDFLSESEEILKFIRCCETGLSHIVSTPELMHKLAQIKSASVPVSSVVLSDAQTMADIASREISNKLWRLNYLAIISLWSSMEALIKELMAEWILNVPASLAAPRLRDVKISPWDFESMDRRHRTYLIIDAIDRKLEASLKSGAGRFEALLSACELDGELPSKLRDVLYELSKVRNVLVHRHGRVDRHFKEACPWNATLLGDRIPLPPEMTSHYYIAGVAYSSIIAQRMHTKLCAIKELSD